jgi:hypothetical protein
VAAYAHFTANFKDARTPSRFARLANHWVDAEPPLRMREKSSSIFAPIAMCHLFYYLDGRGFTTWELQGGCMGN